MIASKIVGQRGNIWVSLKEKSRSLPMAIAALGLATAREFVAEISGRLPTTIDGFVAKHREAFVGTARQRHTNGVVGPHSNPPCSQMTSWPRRPHERFVNQRP